MLDMRCSAALGLVATVAAAGCAKDQPGMPLACTSTDAPGYERALRAAPRDVRLPGGVAISTCSRRVRGDADLQILGTTLSTVAEDLAVRVRATGDVAAARQLGYLTGAVTAGTGRGLGISAELARRVAVTASGVDAVSARVRRALRAGAAAGAARG